MGTPYCIAQAWGHNDIAASVAEIADKIGKSSRASSLS
jgi:hypothetical protein